MAAQGGFVDTEAGLGSFKLSHALAAGSGDTGNFGFHFGASKHNNIDEIRRVIGSGQARSTKVFMNVSTGLMLIEDTALLTEIFKAGGLVFVHAEAEMIGKAIELNARYGDGLYICHISSISNEIFYP